MKPNWTMIGRATLAALVFINPGLGGLHISPGLEAAGHMAVGAAIAFLATLLPQPLAVAKRYLDGYGAQLRASLARRAARKLSNAK